MACFSQNGGGYPDVHRIANVAMEGGRNQKLRGRNRRRSAQPADREFPRAAEVDSCSDQEYNGTDPRESITWRFCESAEQPARYQNRDCARHEDREQERIQDRPESARHRIVLAPRQPAQRYCKINLGGRAQRRSSGFFPSGSRQFHPHGSARLTRSAAHIFEISGDIHHGRRCQDRKNS